MDLVDWLRTWNRNGVPTAITPHMMMDEAAREIERLRKALEITRMQLRVRIEGKTALTKEKWLSIVETALTETTKPTKVDPFGAR